MCAEILIFVAAASGVAVCGTTIGALCILAQSLAG